MKVLYVTHYSALYGANRSLLQLILQLRRRGVVPVVVMPAAGSMSEELRKLEVETHVVPFFSLVTSSDNSLRNRFRLLRRQVRNFLARQKLIRLFRDSGFDLVHTNSSVINIGAEFARAMNLPHVWHVREFGEEDYGLRPLLGFPAQAAFMEEHSARLIFISAALHRKYEGFLQDKAAGCVIPNGVEPARFSSAPLQERPPTEPLRVVICGVLLPGKNQLELLRALALLVQERGKTQIEVVIVGDNSSTFYEAILKKFVAENQLAPYVWFLGFRHDVPEVLAGCDVGVLCSRQEAFGRATVEYMMAGLPVIASDSGANSEILTDGWDGYLYELGDPADLCGKLERFYEDRVLMREMGGRARERACRDFTAELNAERIWKVYQEVLGR